VVDCESTSQGLHYAAEDFETTVYVADGYWQTTIPYWVDLFGVARKAERPANVGRPDVGAGLAGWG
jgi:hypothetical protein